MIRKLCPLMTHQSDYVVQPDSLGPRAFRLTQRQREVLTLISQGHPNKVIADY